MPCFPKWKTEQSLTTFSLLAFLVFESLGDQYRANLPPSFLLVPKPFYASTKLSASQKLEPTHNHETPQLLLPAFSNYIDAFLVSKLWPGPWGWANETHLSFICIWLWCLTLYKKGGAWVGKGGVKRKQKGWRSWKWQVRELAAEDFREEGEDTSLLSW